jgi:membrane protein
MLSMSDIFAVLERIYLFNKSLVKQFYQDQCTHISAALTYTTLLAIVPLLAIVLMVIRQMPFFPELLNYLLVFIKNSLNPSLSGVIEDYLLVFAQKAAHLANLSLVIFFFTSLLTMYTIDTTFNRIWHIDFQRNIIITIVIYTGILVLAPLFIGLSIFVTTYFVAIPYISETLAETGLHIPFFYVWPVVLVGIIFSLGYKTIPNVHVYWRHAFVGGGTAAILFELSKQAFALYLEWFPTYELIYGSIAVIPLLFIWIYVGWLVVLLGAEITFLLGQTHLEPYGEGTELLVLYDVLRLILTQERPVKTRKLQKIGQWNNAIILKSLLLMQNKGIICENSKKYWELTNGFSELTLYDLMRLSGIVLPEPTEKWINKSEANKHLAKELINIKNTAISFRKIKIQELIERDETAVIG